MRASRPKSARDRTVRIYYGLWYPIVVAALTVVVGLLFLPETFGNNIDCPSSEHLAQLAA